MAVVGTPMPSTRQTNAVNSSITTRLPPETNSTNSVIIRPMPVSVIAPTMMPAVAVATAMPIMLRAPAARPSRRSTRPRRHASPSAPRRRTAATSAGRVAIIASSTAVAQNAESAGDRSSTIRHQISTPIGIRKSSPPRTVGQVSGSRSKSKREKSTSS